MRKRQKTWRFSTAADIALIVMGWVLVACVWIGGALLTQAH